MYTAHDLSSRIKARVKEVNLPIGDLLKKCELNPNAISQITDKKGLASFSLAKIADELDCSVDDLLGRTNHPKVNR